MGSFRPSEALNGPQDRQKSTHDDDHDDLLPALLLSPAPLPEIRALQFFRCTVPGGPRRSGDLPRDRFFVLGRFFTVPGTAEGLQTPKIAKTSRSNFFGASDLWGAPPPQWRLAGGASRAAGGGTVLSADSRRVDAAATSERALDVERGR